MHLSDDLIDKKAWVVGLGKSGMACARVLDNCGWRLVLSDSRGLDAFADEQFVDFQNRGHEVRLNDKLEVSPDMLDYVVLSPGISPSLPVFGKLRDANVQIIGEIELAYRLWGDINIVGITGTNGKTTTTVLVKDIFHCAGYEVYAVGNIGIPLISAIDRAGRDAVFVTELSSFQLETTELLRVKVAAIINITPDHLDRHGDMEHYVEAKSRILRNQGREDFAILNLDDERVASLRGRCCGNVIGVSGNNSTNSNIFLKNGAIYTNFHNRVQHIIDIKEIKIPGMHNVENSLIAIGCSLAYGIEIATIAKVLKEFPGVSHRLEAVGVLHGVHFVNDSKGTNIDASCKALDAYQCPIVLIAGGKGKGASYEEFAEKIKKGVDFVVLIGEDADSISQALGQAGFFAFSRAADMSEAVIEAYRHAKKGGIVLLSPACASFDMYKNFEERGEVFTSCVKKLINDDENI
jgi:UDP-N-acetylmuramoylalanine--D-glutamate ligase